MASVGLHRNPEAWLHLPEVGQYDCVHEGPTPFMYMQHLRSIGPVMGCPLGSASATRQPALQQVHCMNSQEGTYGFYTG